MTSMGAGHAVRATGSAWLFRLTREMPVGSIGGNPPRYSASPNANPTSAGGVPSGEIDWLKRASKEELTCFASHYGLCGSYIMVHYAMFLLLSDVVIVL